MAITAKELNAHRLVRPSKDSPQKRPYCTGCGWHSPTASVKDEFTRHLYELTPKRKDLT